MPKKRINDKVTQIPATNNDNENICDSNTQSIIEPQENITEILAKPTKTEISDSDKKANTVRYWLFAVTSTSTSTCIVVHIKKLFSVNF